MSISLPNYWFTKWYCQYLMWVVCGQVIANLTWYCHTWLKLSVIIVNHVIITNLAVQCLQMQRTQALKYINIFITDFEDISLPFCLCQQVSTDITIQMSYNSISFFAEMLQNSTKSSLFFPFSSVQKTCSFIRSKTWQLIIFPSLFINAPVRI